MKIFRTIMVMLLFPIGLFTAPVHAQYAGYTPGRLMEELTRNIQLSREMESALKSNREAKQNHDREKADLDRERSNYNGDTAAYNADLADFNDEVTRYNNECDKKLDRAAFDACESWADRLETQKGTLDQRLQALQATKAAINEKVRAWNDRDLERADEAEQLLSRYDEYDENIKALIGALNNIPAIKNSGRDCTTSPSPEATQQCMQKILDSARQ